MNENPTKTTNRRKMLLIHKHFQITMIVFFVGIAALAIGILFIENLYILKIVYGTEYHEFLGESALLRMIEEDRGKVRIALVLTSMFLLALMTLGGLILSNRVAGPIYRIKRHMEAILEGKDVGKCTFRKGDFFPDLADTYNQVLDHLRKK